MARFILRFRGPLPIPQRDLERIVAIPELVIVDRTPRMLLVEGPAEPIEVAVASMPGWVLSPERQVGLPEPPSERPR